MEKKLPSIYLEKVIGCVQKKAWMGHNTMLIWYNNVCKPHIANYCGISGLLLDDCKWLKEDELRSIMCHGSAISFMITPHYTDVLQ